MAPYHGEESPFEASFRANAAPLLKRIERLERQVKKLKKALKSKERSAGAGVCGEGTQEPSPSAAQSVAGGEITTSTTETGDA